MILGALDGLIRANSFADWRESPDSLERFRVPELNPFFLHIVFRGTKKCRIAGLRRFARIA